VKREFTTPRKKEIPSMIKLVKNQREEVGGFGLKNTLAVFVNNA